MKKSSKRTNLLSGMVQRRILKRDKNFNWFLSCAHTFPICNDGIFVLHRLCLAPLSNGCSHSRLSHRTLTISQTVANAGMGWLGDRVGHRLMLIIGAAAATLSSLLAWFAPSLAWFFPIFVLSGFANVSIWTNGMTMTVDFSDEEERPFYIGLAQTLTAPATIIAPLIGGWIADTQGFVSTFALSTILSVVMMAILFFLVKDPRKTLTLSPLPLGEETQGALHVPHSGKSKPGN